MFLRAGVLGTLRVNSVTPVEMFLALSNLSFGFLTQRVRGAFPPYSVGGILASRPAIGKISKQ